MTRLNRLSWIMVSPVLVYWGWVMATDVGRPSFAGQPALVSDHAAYGVDGPTGFDQAQGRGL